MLSRKLCYVKAHYSEVEVYCDWWHWLGRQFIWMPQTSLTNRYSASFTSAGTTSYQLPVMSESCTFINITSVLTSRQSKLRVKSIGSSVRHPLNNWCFVELGPWHQEGSRVWSRIPEPHWAQPKPAVLPNNKPANMLPEPLNTLALDPSTSSQSVIRKFYTYATLSAMFFTT